MTAREHDARRYSRRCRQRRQAKRARCCVVAILSGICLVVLWGCFMACGSKPQAKTPVVTLAPPVQSSPINLLEVIPSEEPTPEHRDDIVSDGRLLSYELQETMQDCCEEYEVPYALALAIAEVETHFDPDAVSSTGDYGLMQINTCNHEWLLEMGLDPMTHAGNIESGIYIISQHLQRYGEPELALMAYNCGPTGAKRLWDAGTHQTAYSRKVMDAFDRWTSLLEG